MSKYQDLINKTYAHCEDYIGHYAKRFYQPFKKENIYKIVDFRWRLIEQVEHKGEIIVQEHKIPEFFLKDEEGGNWYDCEDSCIITNELPIRVIPWVANVYSSEYDGYNPFNGKDKIGYTNKKNNLI